MTPDPGFAPIFHGWNVWDVFGKNDLDFEIGGVGLSPEKRLRIWVDRAIRDGAPAAEVADPANPATLVGDVIGVLENAGALTPAVRKESVPGPPFLLDGPATSHTVRFFNRGPETALSWPHSSNFLLDVAYQPSAASPITAGPGPGTLAGTVSDAAKAAEKTTKLVVTILAVAAAGGALIWIINQASKSRRRLAA
jgi:hypothetical protein